MIISKPGSLQSYNTVTIIKHENTNDITKQREVMPERIVVSISIRYPLDAEYSIDFKFMGGQMVAIGGIAET